MLEKDIDYWHNKILFSFGDGAIEEIEVIHSSGTAEFARKNGEWV